MSKLDERNILLIYMLVILGTYECFSVENFSIFLSMIEGGGCVTPTGHVEAINRLLKLR